MKNANQTIHKIFMFLLYIMGIIMFLPFSNVFAKEDYSFKTEYTIKEAADNYYIAYDGTKYGLLDKDGEEAIEFDYDEMHFQEDSRQYPNVMVRQNENWGVLDFDGKEIVPIKAKEAPVYNNDNTVAAAYDGNKTFLYDLKGKEIGDLSGQYSVISDNLFLEKIDGNSADGEIRNANDSKILNLSEEKLVKETKNEDSEEITKEVNIKKLGENIIAQYYFPENASQSEMEDSKSNKLAIKNYLIIYNEKGDINCKVQPAEKWVDGEEDTRVSSMDLEEVLSDHTVKVKVKIDGQDDFHVIYDSNKEEFSSKYKKIGTFINEKAFAIDADGILQIIDTEGNPGSEEVEIDSYEYEFGDDFKFNEASKSAFMVFKKIDEDDNYKLYSSKTEKALDAVYTDVDKEFLKNNENYAVVSKEETYGIIDATGKTVVDYDEDYSKKDVLGNTETTFSSDSCLCVIEKQNNDNKIHAYDVVLPEKNSIVDKLPIIPIIIGLVVLIVIILVAVFLKMKKSQKERALEEERKEKERKIREEKKKKQMARNKYVQHPENYGQHIKNGQQNSRRSNVSPEKRVQRNNTFSGCIKGIRGEYAGAVINMRPGEKIRVGRSDKGNDLILNNEKISRKHCVISYDESTRKYHIVDCSSNGVYLKSGSRIKANMEFPVEEGTVIFIGNDEVALELTKASY